MSDGSQLHRRLYEELAKYILYYRNPRDFEYKLKEALRQGFPIDFKYCLSEALSQKHKHTLLCRSVCCKNCCDYACVLLDCGADPNERDKFGFNLLARAIQYRRPLRLTERLADAGADVNDAVKVSANVPDGYKQTAFSHAARHFIYGTGEEQEYGLNAARLLLDHGADPYLGRGWLKDYANDNEQERLRRKQFKEWTDGCIRQREAAELAAKEDDESFMR